MRVRACLGAALGLTVVLTSSAQSPSADTSELITRETQPSFKLEAQRNLVVVRAIVRDSKGHPVSNLRKEDFRLFDNGKPHTISQFGIEGVSAPHAKESGTAQKEVDPEALPETATALSKPERYLALYFDDVHLAFDEIARTRDAADRYLASAIQPSDRVGIFTASGQTVIDFTDNREKLHQSIFSLRERPIVPLERNPCPDISDYQAYLMIHRRDPFALQIAAEETLQCRYRNDERYRETAWNDAESEAFRVMNFSETESEAALRGLDQLVRRMGSLPGQRQIVMLSPGFLTETMQHRTDEVVERALRFSVIINTFDARGLYTVIPYGDVSKRAIVLPQRVDLMGKKGQIEITHSSQVAEALRYLAYDTGGEYFHNSNDFDEGFRKVGALPEIYYVLAFSPQNLKYDGRFHSLKITVVPGNGLTVQARRGYFAPRERLDPSLQAKEEIQQAIFSQDEVKELPIEVHTQFFKPSEADAKLSVLIHVDIHLLRFRKGEGRNLNNLTFVTALFDRDGKYMIGKEKLVEFHLRDESLDKLLQSGITTKTTFDVKPGTYLVRQVVRDGEGGQLSGLNRTVEIPF